MFRAEEIAAVLLAERLSLTAFIAGITRDLHLAEDVFQEICVKAVAWATEFESAAHLIHWARLSGKNRAIDNLRTRDGGYEGLSEDLLATLAADWPEKSSAAPLQEALLHCIEKVTPNNRELLRLRYFERRSCDKIAAVMGRKIESLYQSLARLHKTLGDCVRARVRREAV